MAGSPGGKEVGRLNLKVLPDTSEFLEELKAFAERVEEQVKVEIPVELDSLQAIEEIRQLQTVLDSVETGIDVAVDLDGAGALTELDILLAAMQGTAALNPVEVEVDVDGQAAAIAEVAALNSAMDTASTGAGLIGRKIALWGPLIFIASALLAAIAPALLILFPLVAGIALGAGAIAAGWTQLKDVLKPIQAAFKGIREEIGDMLVHGLAPMIKEFVTNFTPAVVTALGMFAELFNQGARSLLGFLNSNEGIRLFADTIAALGPAFEPFAGMVGPAMELFLRIVQAAAPALDIVAVALAGVVDDLNTWFASGHRAGPIIEAVRTIGELLQIVGKFARESFPTLQSALEPTVALLKGFFGGLGLVMQVLKPLMDQLHQITPIIEVLGAILGPFALAWALVAGAVALFNLVMAANPIVLVIAAIIGLVAGIIYAYKNFETFRTIVDAVWAVLKTTFAAGLAFITSTWTAVWGALLPILQAVWRVIQPIVRVGLLLIATYFRTYWTIISTVVRVAVAVITAVVRTAIAVVMATVRGISAVVGIFRTAWDGARAAVAHALDSVYNYVGDIPGRIRGFLGGMGTLLIQAGRDLIGGFISGIRDMFGDVQGALGELTGSLTSWKGPETLDRVILYDAGRLVIEGFQRGLESQYGAVEDSLGGFTDGLASAAAFDATADLGASLAGSPLLRALDGAVSGGASGVAHRFVFDDWMTGMGYFEDIAESKVEAYAAVNAAADRMGAPA